MPTIVRYLLCLHMYMQVFFSSHHMQINDFIYFGSDNKLLVFFMIYLLLGHHLYTYKEGYI